MLKISNLLSKYDNIEEFPSDDKVIVVKGDTYYEHINTIEEEFFDYFDQLDKSLYSWVDYNRTIKLNILSKNGDDYSKISTSYMYEMTDNIDVVNDMYEDNALDYEDIKDLKLKVVLFWILLLNIMVGLVKTIYIK